MGFRCLTVGRNFSAPDPVDNVIRSLLRSAHCLIGVATARLDAIDRGFPESTLVLTTPYLLEESSMAFQDNMPFLIFKTPEVTLQGVTRRNLSIEIKHELHNGRVQFFDKEELVLSSLGNLREQARERSQKQSRDEVISRLTKISALLGLGWAGKTIWDWYTRPRCFSACKKISVNNFPCSR